MKSIKDKKIDYQYEEVNKMDSTASFKDAKESAKNETNLLLGTFI